jgi:Ca-activated chloride channel homolog
MAQSKGLSAISISIKTPMRGPFSSHRSPGKPANHASRIIFLTALAALFLPFLAVSQTQEKQNRNRPRALDRGIDWKRDPSTGELHLSSPPNSQSAGQAQESTTKSIQVVAQMVSVTCSVSTLEGDAVPGLTRANFRVFDNGVEQNLSYFDASSAPASVALVIDASPSVLPASDQMKKAAEALVDALAPLDQAAVVDFSSHTYLQLPFSDVRELVRRAVARIDVRQLLADTGGSNIYEAVYLTAHDLFPGRKGRKAIVLLTDGQDSGLGLTLDPASEFPLPGLTENRIVFDDVARFLANEDIDLFAVSTENRPKLMTPAWLASHASTTLVTLRARDLEVPPYTLYLAELVRRAGGELYFLREKPTVAETFREIAKNIRAEYTLGYYPSSVTDSPIATAGRHELRVEVLGQADVRVDHRSEYYIYSPN